MCSPRCCPLPALFSAGCRSQLVLMQHHKSAPAGFPLSSAQLPLGISRSKARAHTSTFSESQQAGSGQRRALLRLGLWKLHYPLPEKSVYLCCRSKTCTCVSTHAHPPLSIWPHHKGARGKREEAPGAWSGSKLSVTVATCGQAQSEHMPTVLSSELL